VHSECEARHRAVIQAVNPRQQREPRAQRSPR
jgi:heme exporter protein D